jgi:signal transduction histidine kinase/ABC-type multidrug transport system ATPase subunit
VVATPDVRDGRWATALHVRGVSKRYGRLAALDRVSMSVRAGEIVAVVGENGAGKSTLVRCVAGEVDADSGRIEVHRPNAKPDGEPDGVPAAAIGVVWQDLGLCDDLDVVANIFLGREPGRLLLAEAMMVRQARRVLDRLGSPLADLRAPVDTLSRGERQEVALARALASGARILVLDEPTASLSVMRRTQVVRLLRQLRDEGRAILLVSHDLEEAFALADRIVVLRHGRVVASVSPSEVHADDVTALMSGIETESTARRQLNRLKSLVEQLSSAAPAASLPIVLSATAVALGLEMLCVHLRESRPHGAVLRRTGAVGLPPALLATTAELPVGTDGGPVGAAVHLAELVTVDDIRYELSWSRYLEAAADSGVRSVWSAPIVGNAGVLGAITGFSAATGRLDPDRAELVSLYAGHAASAIEREHLLEEVSRRNRVLESLRAMLETLAGPDRGGGLSAALLALCRGLGAGTVGVLLRPEAGGGGDGSPRWLVIDLVDGAPGDLHDIAVAAQGTAGQAARAAPGVAVAGLPRSTGAGVLACRWPDPDQPSRDGLELLDDARHSLALAIEREDLERARRDAAAARRSQALQRELLQQLSHELRTPLTAVRGYASTLRQPDLTWDAAATDRFLAAIAAESERMQRLVDDLLDSSAIESGLLRLRRDWTDLRLVLAAAVRCVPQPERVDLRVDAGLEPIWADHDRLQQVFVNLLENALRHGRPGGDIEVMAGPAAAGTSVEVLVRDDGPGVPRQIAAQIFEPRVRGEGSTGAGLGLAIARGIAEAHGGGCELLCEPPTTFRVLLPVEPPDSEAPDGLDPLPQPAATVEAGGWRSYG